MIQLLQNETAEPFDVEFIDLPAQKTRDVLLP